MGVADAGMGAMVHQLSAIVSGGKQTPCVRPAKPGYERLWSGHKGAVCTRGRRGRAGPHKTASMRH